MSLSLVGLDGNPWTQRDMDASRNNVVTTYHKLAPTGSYVSGGDTADLTSIASQVASGMLPLLATIEGNGPAADFSGQGGYAQFALGSTISNGKIKFFAAGGTEESASSYSSLGITADVITVVITWRKLLSQ